MMENKSKPAKFRPLSYASALRGKQGVRIEVKPKSTPAPAPAPAPAPRPTLTPASTPVSKSQVPFKLTATAPAWKPTVQQPSPAVPDHRQIEQAKSTRLTSLTLASRPNDFPQLSRPVAKPKLAAVSYAQAVTGKRTPALVIAKQQNGAPQANPIRARGSATVAQDLETSLQNVPQKSQEKKEEKASQKNQDRKKEKSPEKGPQKPPDKSLDKGPLKTAGKTAQKGTQKDAQKDAQKGVQKGAQNDDQNDDQKDGQKGAQRGAQKGPEKSPKKNQKKSPKKKKKNDNTTSGANTAVSDSTIKAQPIPQHPKVSKQCAEPERKTAARIERGPTTHQNQGLPSENTTRSNIACKTAAGDANTPRKYANVERRSQSPSIPPKPKNPTWKFGSSTTKARQKSSTFSGFDFSLHPFHTQSFAPTASNLLCQSPLSTNFATPLFARHLQDNHRDHQTRFPSQVFSSTMPRFVIPSRTQGVCPRPGLELISRPRPSTGRNAGNALGSDDFSIHCDEPGFEGLWPKAVRHQKRIVQLIRKHDNKEIDLFRNPQFWDMQIDCGDRTFYVHRAILIREYTHFSSIAAQVICDGRRTGLEINYTTPARMANVLAFLYDNDIMATDRFAPSVDRPLNGAPILNNVLASIAALETDCLALGSAANTNLENAVTNALNEFEERAKAYQSAVDDALLLDTPVPEFSSFVSDDEFASFYKPFRIAVQAMKDTSDHQPTLWHAPEAANFRTWMRYLGAHVFIYLLRSKTFREEELPKWEQHGLLRSRMNDTRLPLWEDLEEPAERTVVGPIVEGFE